MFLVESGADPTAENRWGRMSLEFAEHLSAKYPEESERQEIVGCLHDWNSEQHEIDDATIVNAAKEIWGLNGGFKLGAVKKAVQSFCESHPKTAAVGKSVLAGAGTGAGMQSLQEGVSCCRGKKEDGSLGRIWEQTKAGVCEGVAGDTARHGIQKIAGEVPGIVAEGTAIGATRCAMDNSSGIMQDLWGIAGGIAGTALGATGGHPLVGGMLGEAIGEGAYKILENAGEWAGEKLSDMLFSKEIEEAKKPVAKQETISSYGNHETEHPEKPAVKKEEEDPEMQYYCEHCNANFWRRRSREVRCGSERKNTCQRCGRLGSRASLLSSFGGHSFGGHSLADARRGLSEEEDPEMEYHCQHCSANFWRRRSHEVRCGPEGRKNTCPRCGRLGSRTLL
jgi:DNA-directed RNA polymerase subunit RPC12/RpoP